MQTLPDYTFTAESVPCPKGFVWFEEPIQLEPEAPHQAPLRAPAWSVLSHRQDSDGVPVLFYANCTDRGPTQLRVIRLQDGTSNKRWAVRDQPSTVPLEERLGFNRAFHRFLARCLSFLEQRIATSVEGR